jgi:Proline racemase
MLEPRGHADMYGALVTAPVTDDGDVGVLFTHNDGYSTMCGHGVIALGAVLPETGEVDMDVDPADPEIRLDTPAGRVTARPRTDDDPIRRVAFENVPSYVVDLDRTIHVPDRGTVRYDLAFGGAYYAYCDVTQFGLSLDDATHRDLVDVGRSLKSAVAESVRLEHPADDDLGFLYGAILTDQPRETGDLRNVCVFADGEVDRSPTGTGVSGHLAIQHERGTLSPGEPYTVESLVGSTFTGRISGTTAVDGREAVIPEVEGEAHIVGSSSLTVDPSDPFSEGFVLR